MDISQKHPPPSGDLTSHHVRWKHGPPPADPPWHLLRCALVSFCSFSSSIPRPVAAGAAFTLCGSITQTIIFREIIYLQPLAVFGATDRHGPIPSIYRSRYPLSAVPEKPAFPLAACISRKCAGRTAASARRGPAPSDPPGMRRRPCRRTKQIEFLPGASYNGKWRGTLWNWISRRPCATSA